jgi:hypothetical protein
MIWPGESAKGVQALVAGPASSFHLNYNTKGLASASGTKRSAKLWYNAARGDMSMCLSVGCDSTQQKSGYTLFSVEGSVDPKNIPPPGMPGAKGASTKIYFSWSAANTDNWATNSSACPGPSYTNCGNADGFLYTTSAKGRVAMVSTPPLTHSTPPPLTHPPQTLNPHTQHPTTGELHEH